MKPFQTSSLHLMDTVKRARLDDGDAEGDMVDSKPFLPPPLERIKMQNRPAFTPDHKIQKFGSKYHLLIGVTGSVASIKLKELTDEIRKQAGQERVAIKIVATNSALHFVDFDEVTDVIYEDRDEWGMWTKRGDPVLHIELRKWADGMVIAPLDANTLGKIANGLCDNLLTCVVRAWDFEKPLHFAPAMNTCMYSHPLTFKHVKVLKEMFQYKEIPAIEKELMCGDRGYGAMANVKMIASIIASDVRNRFAVYSTS
ncbi:hypothetical protein QR680_003527 [Steinernema hermaphroditum]|uniref:Flavoprotein domain-containing protein n=1 Tax=Steinernema hermaphroditum TaxID=289476 RepID=A0AA39HM27_9BILA|nr:hypothetical protein QR680_003527 [Steinernema hermaphroditum]